MVRPFGSVVIWVRGRVEEEVARGRKERGWRERRGGQ